MNETLFFLAQAGPGWRDTWPFGPGYAEGWLSTILKFAFIGLVFLLICGFLRLAFGPGGWWREKHWDEPGGLSDDEPGSAKRSSGREKDKS
ncbi:MAG: hypothetical protein HQK81_03190 [Desulfovibrionaceae bacterium]|nr:hypothetical protein [Desulfovibrionaceae bacterium]MBF0513051.1 hypothetical protein [Desulfovibrionaceae bacterium]